MKELAANTRNLFNINLTSLQLGLFEQYEHQLITWNERINLTAICDPAQIRVKHFLDSLACLSVMGENPNGKIIDVGTGAGLPGIPLKIALPTLSLSLVESVSKKCEFCQHVVKTLSLEGVEIISERAESVGHHTRHRQNYHYAVARAVANLVTLVEYLLPLLRIGGTAIAMKGETAPVEAQEAEHAITLLGGHLRKLEPITLPGVVEQRYLVIIDKIVATPDEYPRRIGLPVKKPLKKKPIAKV